MDFIELFLNGLKNVNFRSHEWFLKISQLLLVFDETDTNFDLHINKLVKEIDV